MWIRQCQECLHLQFDKKPEKEMTPGYRERKCKKCKSPALDYGKEMVGEINPDAKMEF